MTSDSLGWEGDDHNTRTAWTRLLHSFMTPRKSSRMNVYVNIVKAYRRNTCTFMCLSIAIPLCVCQLQLFLLLPDSFPDDNSRMTERINCADIFTIVASYRFEDPYCFSSFTGGWGMSHRVPQVFILFLCVCVFWDPGNIFWKVLTVKKRHYRPYSSGLLVFGWKGIN